MSPEQVARGGPLPLIVVSAVLLAFALYVKRTGRPAFLVPPPLRGSQHGERVA